MAMSEYLEVHDCKQCKYRANGTHQHPCNKCYSRNGNCTQQFFLDKTLSHKPLGQLPANDIDLLTMSVDQLMYENAKMAGELKQLRKEHNKLIRELARGDVPGPMYSGASAKRSSDMMHEHIDAVKEQIRKHNGGFKNAEQLRKWRSDG